MKIIACYSMKGGVGKTATAVNLAWFAAQAGKRTLLVDMDPQGASSFYFQVKSKKKPWGDRFFEAYETLLKHVKSTELAYLDVIPAHLSFRHFDITLSSAESANRRLKKILKGFKKQYDLIILDCPPTISLLSESVFHAADTIPVPVIPTTLSERTYAQLLSFFEEHGLPTDTIVPFFSMVQKQKHMHKETMARLSENHTSMLKSYIPFSADIEKMGEFCAPLGEFGKQKPAYIYYKDLWSELKASKLV